MDIPAPATMMNLSAGLIGAIASASNTVETAHAHDVGGERPRPYLADEPRVALIFIHRGQPIRTLSKGPFARLAASTRHSQRTMKRSTSSVGATSSASL